jgi:hypothetical protein
MSNRRFDKTENAELREPHEFPHVPESPPLWPESRESPEVHECLGSPESPCVSVYPVSNGQELEEELKCLAVRCACSGTNKPAKRRFELARSVRAVEKKIGRKLTTAERMLAFDEWCSVSG